ncbi:tRNA (guanine(46)-N(7))-methyltransferase TrmB [Microbaculum marinisediminis]|uniref:tRNA (guanine(46)-N(7))-methyltransferase TrmB n=1 Tax=Microbaculum marinisediminis TaxID=2931392 RepID=UPI003CC5B4BF
MAGSPGRRSISPTSSRAHLPEDRARRLLYGRHKGHKLRPRQAGLLETLLPRLALPLDGPCPADPRALFPAPVEAVHLEIGFGGGEHLGFRADENRDVGFIGCEPFVNGVAKLLVEIEERGLDNIRVHDDDARQVIDWLPAGSLDCVWLLYPDPWPKRRHRKRRFLSGGNLDALARVMKCGAELRFATDIDDYADRSLRLLAKRDDFVWTAERGDDWRNPWQPWPGTRYEEKAVKAGRFPCYLTFRRV